MLTAHSPAYEYQVGGSLPMNAPTYVRRRADEELYQALLKSEFCYLLNARQMGKSSLRVQTMSRLVAAGVSCGVIDITAIGTQQVTPEQWYASVGGILAHSFQLKLDLRNWWRERSHLSVVMRLNEFLEVLLGEVDQKIVIFIDEIDSVLGLKFPIDDFFALIRACYNKRAEQPAYRRLTFALIGVATPADLIADKTRTPFNIGRAIQLRGFRLSEAMPLVPGLGRVVSNPEAVLSQILVWSGGQPFMTQKLCQLVTEEVGGWGETNSIPYPLEAIADFVEHLVQRHIIDNWEAQDEPEHLKTIRDRLLRNEQRAGRLLGLYQQILQQEALAADDSSEQVELLLSGLVVKSKGKLTTSNHIYKAVFNSNWVEKQLSKLRPY